MMLMQGTHELAPATKLTLLGIFKGFPLGRLQAKRYK